jgi:glycosyltransferase involved in cell wall biosynthesis
MHVVYDEQIFAVQTHGGISRYLCEIAPRVASRGEMDVTVLAPLYVNSYLRNYTGVLSVRKVGIFVPKLPKTGRIIRFVSSALARQMMPRLLPTVIHQTYYAPVHDSRAARVVLTVHDMNHEMLPEFTNDSASREQKHSAIRRADHVICVSENTKRDLLRFVNLDPAKISVIHHGATALNAAPLPIFTSKPYLLFVGPRLGYKNFDRFLTAYASSKLLRENFLLTCFGGGAFSRFERARMAQLGLPPERVIHVAGDDAVLAAYYANAAAFVYPSLYEGFGIPILEAMTRGCPVACSNRSSFPEVAGSAASFFDPESIDSIAWTVETLVSSEERRAALIVAGRRRAQAFTWERCASETEQVYKSLC